MPLYYQMRDYGLLNSRLGLILALIGVFMPFAVFWMRAHFLSVPKELSEASAIDGATTWREFRYVQIPLALPAISSMCLLLFIWTWNSFLQAIVLIDEPTHRTMAGALLNFVGHARQARAAILLTLALPGGACLHQGEELGLPEVEDLPPSTRQHPVYSRSGGTAEGRDGCRVPLPWPGDRPPFGFSAAGKTTWLPQPAAWSRLTAQAQEDDPHSMLTLYRTALRLRRETTYLAGDDLTWQPSASHVLAFNRGGGFRCVVNLGTEDVLVDGEVLLSSIEAPAGVLPPDATAWLSVPPT